ncbi:aminophospholipid ATPase 1 [Actinidia rufa]|uniref:Phospholipid-transporting ATPase n=1 Tax=Actinidia rufa TaxID=165716 RepID=A0A7J0EBS2_9ERIC|nr:aminophospholipid ATPase 1 [Actinidia rufa]
MTSGEPLLSSSDPLSAPPPNPLSRISSLGCLCPNASFSSSIFEDTPNDLFDVNEGENLFSAVEKALREGNLEYCSPLKSSFCSAESQIIQQFPLKCPPQDRKRMVSWGGSMELQQNSLAFGISGGSSHVPENKSQRIRHKSIQIDDNLSHEENPRLIYINDPRTTNDKYEFTGNEIRTSKYTLINFLPKNLFIQFHRVAYLYFLAIAALNQLPPLAVFGRTVSLFPLLFVLCVTAIKDGYEDWRRHRSDQNENNREALVLQSGKFQFKKWKKIRAGEVVKICADDTIPCDMVLLGTSDPSGIAYIQTMNLDGESNLKTRYARQETTSMVFEGGSVSGLIRCEQPNRNIYEFTANMEMKGKRFPLSQSNIILRGCQLKNTEWLPLEWVYGFSATKDRLDSLPYYRKTYFGGRSAGKSYKFYGIPMETFFSFLSSIIVFQIMIPISLYITMELVRLGQSYFMIGDKHMYDSSTDSRFQCRSLNINEDLGQIRYVFSDKTGTLTENKMEFQKASVHGKNYGSSMLMSDTSQDTNITVSQTAAPVGKSRWKLKSEVPVDSELMAFLRKELAGDERIAAHEFFLTLATCNTVIPVLTRSLSSSCMDSEFYEDAEAVDYQGESPDEQALVAAASAYGYTLFERTSGHVVIDVNGEKLRLDVLGLHEFDSVRKRMSVVIRFPNDSVKVLVKGADTSILSILKRDAAEDGHIRHATQSHLNEYSSEGLRTLVIASRDLTDAELEEWQCMYEDASTSLTDRSIKLCQTAALIECNLQLIGATGIEDKLQEGVPEAIESLRQAGIKVWVLTGDKQETAISIGLSCKLLTSDMQQIIINGASEEECRNLLSDAKAKYGVRTSSCRNWNLKWKRNAESHYLEIPNDTKLSNVPMGFSEKEEGTMSAALALIIDGNSLVYILEKDLESELFDLATSCKVVLCCRVAPLQKAGIVDLIKSRTDDMTLAIGDGANDVSMIQMADVGVGICGQEGRQAVMASDFAMGQFRFLKRLLLVHGHWNYHRVGYLVLYNFYRNAVFVLMLFWYILSTAFSTTSALTDWSSVFYSVIYTSVPTIVVGILDKDLSHKTLLEYPKLYGAGHRQESYNMYLFWITMIDTLWQSLVLFLYTFWGSIIITYACVVVLDSIPRFPNYGTIYHLAKSPTYWLSILLIICLALLPRFIFKVLHQTFWPSDIQIAREAEILRKRPNHVQSKPDQSSS